MRFLGIDGPEIRFAQLTKVYVLLLIYLSVLGAKLGKGAFPIGYNALQRGFCALGIL